MSFGEAEIRLRVGRKVSARRPSKRGRSQTCCYFEQAHAIVAPSCRDGAPYLEQAIFLSRDGKIGQSKDIMHFLIHKVGVFPTVDTPLWSRGTVQLKDLVEIYCARVMQDCRTRYEEITVGLRQVHTSYGAKKTAIRRRNKPAAARRV